VFYNGTSGNTNTGSLNNTTSGTAWDGYAVVYIMRVK
jgi:hypothetical protein